MQQPGINLVGRFQLPLGTAAAARMVADAICRGGVPHKLYAPKGNIPGRENESLAAYPTVATTAQLPFASSLLLDSIMLLDEFLEGGAEFFATQKTATVIYWELDRYPKQWQQNFQNFSTLYAPSRFIQHALEENFQIYAGYLPVTPLYDFENISCQPQPNRPFTFFLHFDLMSTFDRKNPAAVIDSFCEAFGNDPNVQLVLKIWESDMVSLAHDIDFPENQNIRVVRGDLDYRDTLQLIADADVYVSLHRAEGLGLGILEAMALGKPVIATGYGGTTDFVSSRNGFPIPYTLVPVESIQPCYKATYIEAEPYWAEPNLLEVVRAMRSIAGNPAQYQQLSARARLDFAARRAQFLSLDWLQHFLTDPADTNSAAVSVPAATPTQPTHTLPTTRGASRPNLRSLKNASAAQAR